MYSQNSNHARPDNLHYAFVKNPKKIKLYIEKKLNALELEQDDALLRKPTQILQTLFFVQGRSLSYFEKFLNFF